MDMSRIHPWIGLGRVGLGPYFSIMCWIGLSWVLDMIGWVGLGPAYVHPCLVMTVAVIQLHNHAGLCERRLTTSKDHSM